MPLDVLRSGVSNDALAKIDHTLLVAAFRSDERESIFCYDTAFGIDGDGSDEQYRFVRNAMRFDTNDRAYELARFTMDANDAKHFSNHSRTDPSAFQNR